MTAALHAVRMVEERLGGLLTGHSLPTLVGVGLALGVLPALAAGCGQDDEDLSYRGQAAAQACTDDSECASGRACRMKAGNLVCRTPRRCGERACSVGRVCKEWFDSKGRNRGDRCVPEQYANNGDDSSDPHDRSDQDDPSDSGDNSSSRPSDGRSGSGPTNLPKVTGTCPEFRAGDITFRPKGVGTRKARIWIGSEAQTKDGPLIFYWQGTGMSPNNATWHVGRKAIDEVTSMGGMVVAPYPDPSLEFPWYLSNGRNVLDDFLLADEILACAIEQVGVDTRRIHATGISAGGLMSAEMLIRRANYMASAAPQSGAIAPWTAWPANAQRSNKTAAMVFHGGAGDRWPSGGLDYQQEAIKIADTIVDNGGFALLCNHGRNHTVPMDAIDSIWQFFKDHPWNTSPSPYAKGIPGGFPKYCRIHH